jgi:hypothetical protein
MPASARPPLTASSHVNGRDKQTRGTSSSGVTPQLGGTAALVLFGMILTAFVVQSGITQVKFLIKVGK